MKQVFTLYVSFNSYDNALFWSYLPELNENDYTIGSDGPEYYCYLHFDTLAEAQVMQAKAQAIPTISQDYKKNDSATHSKAAIKQYAGKSLPVRNLYVDNEINTEEFQPE